MCSVVREGRICSRASNEGRAPCEADHDRVTKSLEELRKKEDEDWKSTRRDMEARLSKRLVALGATWQQQFVSESCALRFSAVGCAALYG